MSKKSASITNIPEKVGNAAEKVEQVANAVKEGASKVEQGAKKVKEKARGKSKPNSNKPKDRNIDNAKSWYLHGLSAASLINLNYGYNKSTRLAYLSNYSAGNTITTPSRGAVSAVGIELLLTVPSADSKMGWNQGVSRLFGKIRAANGTIMSYTPYQLEQYIVSVRSFHAIYAMLKRAYGIIRKYNLYDSATPTSYMASIGLDYATFSTNLADVRMFAANIANFIANSCALDIPLFQRTRWLYEHGVLDSNDAKATPYFFFTQYLPVITNGVSAPVRVALNPQGGLSPTATGMTWATFQSAVITAMTSFQQDQMYYEINGDILRAFGQKAIFATEIIPENYEISCAYSEEVLSQVNNAVLTGSTWADFAWSITSNDFITLNASAWTDSSLDTIFTTGTNPATIMAGYNGKYYDRAVVNAFKDKIDPGDTFVHTRLSVLMHGTLSATSATFVPVTWATEVPTQAFCIVYSDSGNMGGLITYNVRHIENIDNDIGHLSQCDYHPRVTLADVVSSQGMVSVDFWDCNNYATVDRDSLAAINTYAVQSLLWAPDLVRVSKTELINK